ncbi:AraC family transcriptional regulator, partial [Streptococcus pneumoniae]|nr:AraC family transcriptional regulator [Streptococcus pneumoniae]
HMGLFFYNKIGSIISIVDLPTTNIIEPQLIYPKDLVLYCTGLSPFSFTLIRLLL